LAKALSQTILSVALLAGATATTVILYLNRPPSDLAEPAYVPVTIDTAIVVKENTRIPIEAQGTVSPLRATSVISEVRGRIVKVSPAFNVGGFVSRDDTLLAIDPRDYQTQLLRTQASVESAESNLAQEQGRTEVARREWDKLPPGSQRSEAAKSLYLRKPQLEQAQAQLLAAQADLKTARDNLERTTIRAPYDALVRKKHAELGQYVAPGTPLVDIFSVDYAEVRLAIPQSQLAYLDLPGLAGYQTGASPVDLYTNVSGEIKHWPAQLHRTEGVFDERSRVLFTVARIEDPYALRHPGRQALRVGTFVNAILQGREHLNLVTLPRHILRAGNLVWVIDDNMQLRSRTLTVLRAGSDNIYVTAGLEEGERVSLTALDTSFSGARVEIMSQTPSNQLQRAGIRNGDVQ
jgi:RND family efflux transporter MFP subunit